MGLSRREAHEKGAASLPCWALGAHAHGKGGLARVWGAAPHPLATGPTLDWI